MTDHSEAQSTEFKDLPTEETITRVRRTRIRCRSVNLSHTASSHQPCPSAASSRLSRKKHYPHCSRSSAHATDTTPLPERTQIYQALYNELQHWQNENENIVRRKIKQYKKTVREKEGQLIMLHEELDQQRREIKMIVSEREQLLIDLQTTQNELSRASEEYESRLYAYALDIHAMNNDKDDEIQALQMKMAAAGAELQRITDLKNQAELDLRADIDRYKHEAAERERELMIQLERLQCEVGALLDELKRLVHQREIIQTERLECVRVINEMFEQLQRAPMTERDNTAVQLQTIHQALCEALQGAKDLEALNRRQIEEAEERLKQREVEVQVETSRDLRAHYEAHIDRLRLANESLQCEYDSSNAAHAELKKEKESLLRQNDEDSKKYIDLLHQCSNKHAQERLQWDRQREQLETELRVIKTELQEFTDQISALHAQIRELSDQIRQTENDIAVTETQSANRQATLQDELRRLNDAGIALKKQLQTSEESARKHQQNFNETLNRCAALRSELVEALSADQAELRAKDGEIDDLAMQLQMQADLQARAEQEHGSLMKTIEELNALVETQKQRADRFEDLVRIAKQDLEECQLRSKESISAANAEARRSEAENNRDRIRQLAADVEELNKENRELHDTVQAGDCATIAARQCNSQMRQHCENGRQHMAEGDKEMAHSHQALEQVKGQQAHLLDEKRRLENEMSRILKETEDVKANVNTLEAQVDKLGSAMTKTKVQPVTDCPFGSQSTSPRSIPPSRTPSGLSLSERPTKIEMFVTAEFMDKLQKVDRDCQALKCDVEALLLESTGPECAELRGCEQELMELLDRLTEISRNYKELWEQNEPNFDANERMKDWLSGWLNVLGTIRKNSV